MHMRCLPAVLPRDRAQPVSPGGGRGGGGPAVPRLLQQASPRLRTRPRLRPPAQILLCLAAGAVRISLQAPTACSTGGRGGQHCHHRMSICSRSH